MFRHHRRRLAALAAHGIAAADGRLASGYAVGNDYAVSTATSSR